MYQITAPDCSEITVSLPASKSVTHRIFILSGLNQGQTTVNNWLDAEDTEITLAALRHMGIKTKRESDTVICTSPIGKVQDKKVYLGNSGSSARFLIPQAAFLDKPIYFYGDSRLHERPFAELFEAMEKLNIKFKSENLTLPAYVYPSEITGGEIRFDSLPSSQIITALMMAGLWMKNDLLLYLPERTPSLPYIQMTYNLMKNLGLGVYYQDNCIQVKAQPPNSNWHYTVEMDLSAASYWVVFSLINNIKVVLPGITLPSLQGDERILEIAEQVGAEVMLFSDRVEITGTIERGVSIDCFDIPDLVPALSILALFAPQKFTMSNIKHLEFKESNRVQAIQNNITALGGKSTYSEGHLTIHPQKNYTGTLVKSYNDHRIAMSFAIAGTRINNITIDNPACVNKSYPEFWKHFTFWNEIE
jgi:3-phosphoshikimate 1-carboxyvinyltransferase